MKSMKKTIEKQRSRYKLLCVRNQYCQKPVKNGWKYMKISKIKKPSRKGNVEILTFVRRKSFLLQALMVMFMYLLMLT